MRGELAYGGKAGNVIGLYGYMVDFTKKVESVRFYFR